MQRFLQFRLGSHTVPIVVGRFAGGQHAARANRVCTHCGGVAVAIDLHVMFECPALHPLGTAVSSVVFHKDQYCSHRYHSFFCSKITCRYPKLS